MLLGRPKLLATLLLSCLLLGAACGDEADTIRRDQASEPVPAPPPFASKMGRVDTVAEALDLLGDQVQRAYLAGIVTTRQGAELIELGEMARDANEAGDFVQAFAFIQDGHVQIEELRNLRESTAEAVYPLHRAFDQLGAMIATHPPKDAGD